MCSMHQRKKIPVLCKLSSFIFKFKLGSSSGKYDVIFFNKGVLRTFSGEAIIISLARLISSIVTTSSSDVISAVVEAVNKN